MSDLPLPEPQAPVPVAEQVFDIQHDTDPATDHGHAKRIPHFGHALLFFALVLVCVLISQIVGLLALHSTTPETAAQHPIADVLSELVGYLLALGLAVPIFPKLWRHSFLDGIHWTARPARRYWWKLVLLGLSCSVLAQLSENLFKVQHETDLLRLFRDPASAWLLAIGGTLIVPLMEEIAFRGFLLPSLATAYDWFSLDRTPAGLQHWRQTTAHTRNALIFAAVFSSLPFALLHGHQLHWARGPLAVLFLVSLAFAAVRIRTRSVAASTLVHLAYDALIMLQLIVCTGGFRHLDRLR